VGALMIAITITSDLYPLCKKKTKSDVTILIKFESVYLLPAQFKGPCHTCDLTIEITRFFCPSKFVWFRMLYHKNLLITQNHTDSSISMNLCDSGPSITQISKNNTNQPNT
jgi:hypothetical protein